MDFNSGGQSSDNRQRQTASDIARRKVLAAYGGRRTFSNTAIAHAQAQAERHNGVDLSKTQNKNDIPVQAFQVFPSSLYFLPFLDYTYLTGFLPADSTRGLFSQPLDFLPNYKKSQSEFYSDWDEISKSAVPPIFL